MPTTLVSYPWRPLDDLPSDTAALTDNELDSLHEVWMDQRDGLAQAGMVQKFNERLQREWAIETGIIERVYTLDRGVTETLIERGIEAALIPHESTSKDPELVARIIQDHVDTLAHIFDFVKGQRELTTSYIKELHASLLRHQDTFAVVDQLGREFDKPLDKGVYKTLPNNPTRSDGSVHEYCPPEHVASEMDRMISLHMGHAKRGVPTEVEAAWLHHVFTQIHPFQDGNGRVARAISSLVFLKAGWFPVVVTREDRTKYIDSLEAADAGDLRPLIVLFGNSQKRALLRVTETVYEVRPPKTVEEVVAAARDRLISRGQIYPKQWNRAKETAQRLLQVANQRFNQVANQLSSEIGSTKPTYQFGLPGGSAPSNDVMEAARQLGYTPNLAQYHQFLRFDLKTAQAASIVVSFHEIGPSYRGLVACIVYFNQEGAGPRVTTDDVFQINYREDPTQAQNRFAPWFERALFAALTFWQQTL